MVMQQSTHLLRITFVVVLTAIFALVSKADAQPKPLFTVSSSNDVSPSQAARLGAVRQQQTNVSIQAVMVDASALNGDAVIIALPGLGDQQVNRRQILVRSATDFTWIGDLQSVTGQAILVFKDGEITGSIQNGANIYSITPLGGGLHAVAKVDQNRFPPDHPPSSNRPQPDRRGDASTPSRPSLALQRNLADIVTQKRAQKGEPNTDALADPIQVDVLVAWTQTARVAQGGTMAAFAQAAVDAANTAYANSNSNVTLRLVGTREITYSDTGKTFDTVLNDLLAGTDPQMAGVHAQRDSSGADLVALMINQTDFCGLASSILANATNAYATVYWNCAVSNHSFAHELGHLFGARHDPFVDPTTTPFAYGHGYITPSLAWRTVMAYVDGCGSCPRLGYFSNPSVLFGGLPMGTAATNDNARVHREQVGNVSTFRGAAKPVNDNFVSATILPAGSPFGTTTGSTVGATREAGEPSHAGNVGGASVWWSWTPTSSGSITFNTIGSSFDTLLAVYTGTTVSALSLVAANDDCCGGLQSSVTFNFTAGVTYRIAVDGFSGASGSVVLNWFASPKRSRDFNGDGVSDILIRHSSGYMSEFRMSGGAIANNLGISGLDPSWSIAGVGDFNGDGRADILIRHSSGYMSLLVMNGSNITSNIGIAPLDLSWSIVGIGDLNGDGRADILIRHSNGYLSLLVMNGSTITSNVGISPLDPSWSVAGIGDFNGDGKADILIRHTTGYLSVWTMNGSTVTGNLPVSPLDPSWSVAGIGDFNGDGKADILIRHSSGYISLWTMNGGAIASNLGVGGLDPSWIIAGVGDFNGDAKTDILIRHAPSGYMSVFLMNGATLTNNNGIGALDLAWSIQ
jgi:hypothetical protein